MVKFLLKVNFTILDTTNITSVFIFKFFHNIGFSNLIPGFYFWRGLGFALRFRYNLYWNSGLTLNMFSIYKKKLAWSDYNIKQNHMDKVFDNSCLKQITYKQAYTIDNKLVLNRFFQKHTTLYDYKVAILSGDLASQKALLLKMNPFELRIALNTQSLLWSNLCNNLSFEHVEAFCTNPIIRNHLRHTIYDFETYFFSTSKLMNCHIITGQQVAGFSMFSNASNLNNFHLKQELALCKQNDFIGENAPLFRNRISQSFDKLGEFNQSCKNNALCNSIVVAPSARSIKTDNYVLYLPEAEVESSAALFSKKFPFKTRFSVNEIKEICPYADILSVDWTKGYQRTEFKCEQDVFLFIQHIIIKNKVNPLLANNNLLIQQKYRIAAEFTFFKSNVENIKVEDLINNIQESVNQLESRTSITVDVTFSIIDDPWNL
jgi:hypothetical protein